MLRLSSTPLDEAVERIVTALRLGQVVALPSDTLYGLVTTLPFSTRLYTLKRRSTLKPLGLFLAQPSDAYDWAQVSISSSLLARLLPGPVTLVFQRSSRLPCDFNPETSKVGIRVPDSALVREVCARIDGPLAQTSANASGAVLSPVRVDEFSDLFSQIDLVVDGGEIGESRAGSTVVDLSAEGFYEIVRDGCAKEQTERILQENGLQKLTLSL